MCQSCCKCLGTSVLFMGDVHYGQSIDDMSEPLYDSSQMSKVAVLSLLQTANIQKRRLEKSNEYLTRENYHLRCKCSELEEELDYVKGNKTPIYLDGKLICEKVAKAWDIQISHRDGCGKIDRIEIDSTKRYQAKCEEVEKWRNESLRRLEACDKYVEEIKTLQEYASKLEKDCDKLTLQIGDCRSFIDNNKPFRDKNDRCWWRCR